MRLERFALLALAVDRGVDQARGDRVDANADSRKVTGDRQGHADDAALRGRVGALSDLAVERGGGRHVDDGAAAAVVVDRVGLGHRSSRAGQHVERADQVDPDHELERVQVERLVVAVDRATGVPDAGGVDERTKRTHLRGGGDRSIGVVGGRHITLDEEATELRGDGLTLLLVEVGDDDTGAGGGQLAGRGLADAGGTSGDDRGGTLEVHTGHQESILSMIVALARPPPSHMAWKP